MRQTSSGPSFAEYYKGVLHAAIGWRHVVLVKQLLDAGFNIDCGLGRKENEPNTPTLAPLAAAILARKPDITSCILEHSADINYPEALIDYGLRYMTPLKHPPIVKYAQLLTSSSRFRWMISSLRNPAQGPAARFWSPNDGRGETD